MLSVCAAWLAGGDAVARLHADAPPAGQVDHGRPDADDTSSAIAALESWLQTPRADRPAIADQPFANAALSRQESVRARELLWDDHVRHLRQTRAVEWKQRVLKIGDHAMPFEYILYGDKPAGGRSLYISLHGGGNTARRVNDQQWRNQIRLYQPPEGVYVAPRAPTDTWNLWHQGHIDGLFDRLIQNMVVFEEVDPDRVYLMGYSAGGDGVYQVAPRMADRFAAAAMMAGHPNETSPLGLRNLPFAIHVGEHDAGYQRNTVARRFGRQLADLREADPDGYIHHVRIHEGKGHWMDRQDAEAVPWMAKYTRKLLPDKVVWKQDDVTHTRFYWLAVDPLNAQARCEVTATRQGQRIEVAATEVAAVIVRLSDAMCDLDKPVSVSVSGAAAFEGKVKRTIAMLAKTLAERGDRLGMFDAEVAVATVAPAEAPAEPN